MAQLTISSSGERRDDGVRRLLELLPTTHGAERRLVEDRLIRLNLAFAHNLASRYHHRGIPTEDLDQVACLGLVKAVRGYDPAQATDFFSYATPTIRGELRRHFRDRGWTVRPPRSVQELQPRITRVRGRLWQELGRDPSDLEVAHELDVGVDDVRRAEQAHGCFAPASLDATAGEDEQAPSERLGSTERGYANVDASVTLQPVLQGLSERERRILQLRFWDGRTQAEIGSDIGVTQMQVSRLLSGIFARLHLELSEAS